MIFDTHAHYDDSKFDEDRHELLAQMHENDIGNIVNVACSMESCETSLKLAEQYPFIYAALGVHPSDIKDLTEEDLLKIEKWSSYKKVVAIGEIGLDYHWEKTQEGRNLQIYWFVKQLNMARRLKLPVIIHSRDAAESTYKILCAEYAQKKRINPGVIHCFSYSKELAKEYVKMGYYIGVGGVVTYSNGKTLKEVVKTIPIENIVVETDCPYLSPEPIRGTRNSSRNLPYVVKQIASLKDMSYEEVAKVTEANARKLYNLD